MYREAAGLQSGGRSTQSTVSPSQNATIQFNSVRYNSNMEILLTNDDGIDAPGLRALQQSASSLGNSVVVAPHVGLSGCGHRTTSDRPLTLARHDDQRYAVDGTPADCVRIGLFRVAPHAKWILSGINAGGNLGVDVFQSGTVAAVREAVHHGRRGIAVSQYNKKHTTINWERSWRWAAPILAGLMSRDWTPGTFWNINLPHTESEESPPIVECSLDRSPLPLAFRHERETFHYDGDYHNRQRTEGSDVDVCFSGKIAVTKVVVF